ncbi:MAG: hypothetical protein GOV02_03400, partial [Candidatus Aenigmarchaeota archaeon]|nr:hypothetical protein [Candidatus Aenigmarchaeota archaeon]
MKLPDLKKMFAKKEVEETPMMEPVVDKPLPEDLEKFRMERTEPKPLGAQTPSLAEERYGNIPERQAPTPVGVPAVAATPEPTPAPVTGDRIDMILQKLETIDTRLKLLEEKMK